MVFWGKLKFGLRVKPIYKFAECVATNINADIISFVAILIAILCPLFGLVDILFSIYLTKEFQIYSSGRWGYEPLKLRNSLKIKMENKIKKKKIDTISMMKGIGILYVVFSHMAGISGLISNFPLISKILLPLATPVMLMFFLLSGYVTSGHQNKIVEDLIKRAKSLLLPYYKISVVMLAFYAIIYLTIEHQRFDWYADGAFSILLQLQSIHLFDTGLSGLHPMFYGVIICWFLFQLTISSLIFLPLLRLLKEKPSVVKLILAVALIAIGALFYALNLQGLNGELFPAVCQIFVLPNIPGIAGILLLGNWLADIQFLKFEKMSKVHMFLCICISLIFLVVLYLTDDCVYNFPVGKWGSYGVLGYFTSTIYGIAVLVILGILCYWAKRFVPIRDFLVFWGNNSKDVLLVHYFFGYLIAYLAGFWVNYLSEPFAVTELQSILHFTLLIVLVPILCYVYIKAKLKYYEFKTNIRNT